MTADTRECLVFFSGGRDSLLASCLLCEQGFRVHLVYFENGAGLQARNAMLTAQRFASVYGDMVGSIGVVSTAGIWREFFLPYHQLTPSEVVQRWGELPVSQFNCLTCRSAMYAWAIMFCRAAGIRYIAEGARKCQNWPIMQPSMIERFRGLLSAYSLQLLLPVHDVASDWQLKNQLLMRRIVPKTWEPQCLIGVPLPNGALPSRKVQEAVETFFDKEILPRTHDLIGSGQLPVGIGPGQEELT